MTHNLEKCQSFLHQCELVFRARPQAYQKDDDKTWMVELYSDQKVQQIIAARRKRDDLPALNWTECKRLLTDTVMPDVDRIQAVSEQFHQAKQRRDQSVTTFALYLDGIRDRMPPVQEPMKTTHFLQALRRDIQSEILAHGKVPETYEVLLESAQRAEHAIRLREPAPRDNRFTPYPRPVAATAVTPRPDSRQPHRNLSWRPATTPGLTGGNQIPLPTRPRNDNKPKPTTPRDKSKDTCNHCGKLGHWEKDCYSKQNGKPPAGKARAQ